MVVSIAIANFMVSKVLIDQGSSTDILYWKTFLMQSYPARALGRRLQVDWARDPRGFYSLVFWGILSSLCSKDFFLYFHVFCHGGELSYYRGCVAKL